MMTTDIDMPGRPRQAWYAKDDATLRSVAIAAYEALVYCVDGLGYAGWKSVGTLQFTPAPAAGSCHKVEADVALGARGKGKHWCHPLGNGLDGGYKGSSSLTELFFIESFKKGSCCNMRDRLFNL